MATPQEQRMIRLKNDYQAMQNIQSDIISWRPLSGIAPHVEAYELTVKVRSIIGPGPNYRGQHIINLTIPENYPRSPPQAVMQTTPPPYHPNWWPADGRWCYGTWVLSEGLADYVIRMVRTLQFDREITNPNSPANGDAKTWYSNNQDKGWFPSDKQKLPDPAGKKFVLQRPNKKFSIQS